ncbi:hypothetical protein BHYA_0021g00590 [Botrytis hyacinthi]|uniref:Uncharacterized protein n=1 Tax=Botrytis hyacinthi TaxID=278943 RepID=A0A4Z1H8X5_9HELO|nr:hypothetical protein BHYA_0021g00590 [Botrytis hyacinthi]
MPLLKITSASFAPSLAGTRDVYTSPLSKFCLAVKIELNRASDRAFISEYSTKREYLNGSSNKIRPTLRKCNGQMGWRLSDKVGYSDCRWEQEIGGNITSLGKPSPTKLSVVPSLQRHIDCDSEDIFEDILQQKRGR